MLTTPISLDRWGADGIVVLSMDCGDHGPDLDLIERLGAVGLSTPLTYGGRADSKSQHGFGCG